MPFIRLSRITGDPACPSIPMLVNPDRIRAFEPAVGTIGGTILKFGDMDMPCVIEPYDVVERLILDATNPPDRQAAVDPVWAAVEAERQRLLPDVGRWGWREMCRHAAHFVDRGLLGFCFDTRVTGSNPELGPRQRIVRALALLRAAIDDLDASGGTNG